MSTPQAFPRHPKLLPTFGTSKDIAVKDKFFEYSLDKRCLCVFRVAFWDSARVISIRVLLTALAGQRHLTAWTAFPRNAEFAGRCVALH
jgi:hypothetical protein